MSMMSYLVLRMIHLRLCQIKNNNDLCFGGVNIILMGDLLQLKPIYGGCIFEQPINLKHEPNLWQLFTMHVLWRNQRQINDPHYGDLCSRIRLGQQTSDDLNVLNNRHIYFKNNPKEFENAIRLSARKKTVEKHNLKCFEKTKQNKTVYKITAVDTYANGSDAGKKAQKKYIYAEENKTGGIIDQIDLTVGCRVMLRRNQDVQIGLVNGAMGTVTAFEWPMLNRNQLESGDLPSSVLIKFDDPSIAEKYDDKVGDSVRVKPITVTFDGKRFVYFCISNFKKILTD